MAKKQVAVTLRKPPQGDVEAFINGGVNAHVAPSDTQVAANARAVGPALAAVPAVAITAPKLDEVVTTGDGRAFREMTVYLPNDLARRLSLHCMESDRDVSRVMAEVLEGHFDAAVEAVAQAAPAFVAPKSRFAANVEMGREIALALWRIRPWAV